MPCDGNDNWGIQPGRSYEPTEREQAALEAHAGRVKKAPPSPRFKTWGEDGVAQVLVDHPSGSHGQALLMEALATTDTDFLIGIVSQLGNAGSLGQKVDEQALNFLLSVVKGVQPKDQLETMLAAQMAAVHSLTMTYARRYLTGGEQKVTVEHVTVNEGGQAIVGNVSNSPTRGAGASDNR